MDNNTYYSCECVYFDKGYITCKICSQWSENTSTTEPKVKPVIFDRRWLRLHGYNNKSKTKS